MNKANYATKEYRTWASLKSRIKKMNPLPPHEPAWLLRRGFTAFLEDVGTAPHPQARLIRDDDAKGFLKENLSWRGPVAGYSALQTDGKSVEELQAAVEQLTTIAEERWEAWQGEKSSHERTWYELTQLQRQVEDINMVRTSPGPEPVSHVPHTGYAAAVGATPVPTVGEYMFSDDIPAAKRSEAPAEWDE